MHHRIVQVETPEIDIKEENRVLEKYLGKYTVLYIIIRKASSLVDTLMSKVELV